jgi:hypothetical protein
MNKEIKIEPAEDPKIEEVKAKEIPKEEKKVIDEKVVFSDKKHMKFYETLDTCYHYQIFSSYSAD